MGIRAASHEETRLKEYALFASCSAIVVVALDFVLKTNLLKRKTFWVFLFVMYGFMTIVNGYLTWRPIVLYNEQFYLGIRFFTIPIEDYVYGFSVMTLSVIAWEYFKAKSKSDS